MRNKGPPYFTNKHARGVLCACKLQIALKRASLASGILMALMATNLPQTIPASAQEFGPADEAPHLSNLEGAAELLYMRTLTEKNLTSLFVL